MSKVMVAAGTRNILQVSGRGYSPEITDEKALEFASKFFQLPVDQLALTRNGGAVIVYPRYDLNTTLADMQDDLEKDGGFCKAVLDCTIMLEDTASE